MGANNDALGNSHLVIYHNLLVLDSIQAKSLAAAPRQPYKMLKIEHPFEDIHLRKTEYRQKGFPSPR
jgi:hypothetical protein